MARIKIDRGTSKGRMLVKVTKKEITIMPAINPDGTPTKPPRGFKWIPVTEKWVRGTWEP